MSRVYLKRTEKQLELISTLEMKSKAVENTPQVLVDDAVYYPYLSKWLKSRDWYFLGEIPPLFCPVRILWLGLYLSFSNKLSYLSVYDYDYNSANLYEVVRIIHRKMEIFDVFVWRVCVMRNLVGLSSSSSHHHHRPRHRRRRRLFVCLQNALYTKC